MEMLTAILNVIIYSLLGGLAAFATFRFSLLLFNIRLSDEIRSGNRAAGAFAMGLLIMIGLIIGLVGR